MQPAMAKLQFSFGVALICLVYFLFLFTSVESQKYQDKINIPVLSGELGGNVCPSQQNRDAARRNIRQEVLALLSDFNHCGEPGWTQVAYIDMTNSSYTCPPGLNLISYPKRTCGRSNPTSRTCSLTSFRVGFTYNQICGRIKAYQWGYGWGLWNFFNGYGSIGQTYLDGLSLTHGPNGDRHHIWSFIASIYANSGYPESECPCDRNYEINLPSFVGENYFCESVVRQRSDFQQNFFPNNPLWDGQNCGESGNTCCQVNNPPWFKTTLGSSTADNIDLRMCAWGGTGYTDIPIEVIELYVK